MWLGKKSYREAIDAASRRDPGRARGVHPSELDCPRRVVLDLLGAPKKHPEISRSTQIMLDLSHAVHDMVQKYYVRATPELVPGGTFEAEVPVNSRTCPKAAEYCVEGHADGAAYLPAGDELLEIKTKENALAVQLVSRPTGHHLRQLNIYMYCLDIHQATVMYVARQDPEACKFFPVSFDANLWESTAVRIRQALDSSLERRLPPADGIEESDCRLCQYKHLCTNKGRWLDAPDYRA